MLLYYVQIKDRHDPGINIREKASIVSINETGISSRRGWGALRPLAGTLGGRTP